MKKIKIKYNPYLISTEILVDEQPLRENSSLWFNKLRLQEWAESFSGLFVEEYKDQNASIEFTGILEDYNDLKEAINTQNRLHICEYKLNRMPDVENVEESVISIFNDIQNGPVESLKDSKIINAFEEATRSEFVINVVAPMSAGKSSLINSILGKQLMPTGNRATTATIVRITATNTENYGGIAYDAEGNEIERDEALSLSKMKLWNEDANISMVDIFGPIPCVEKCGMRLVLIDTPGPNNSKDENHKRLTYDMLNASDKSLVLFVLDATSLFVNDEDVLLSYVCGCMKKGNKQSRERYVFAINKINAFDEAEDDVKSTLSDVQKGLDERDIKSANIFPVGARVAYDIRAGKYTDSWYMDFKEKCVGNTDYHFEQYYNYNHLPLSSKSRIDQMYSDGNELDQLLVHTGIPSIEEAVRMYVNKYARTMKVKDLVDSFNKRLSQLKAVAKIQKLIEENEDAKATLEANIASIKEQIESGQSAQTYVDLIKELDVTSDVEEELSEHINALQLEIDKELFDSDPKVPKADAEKKIKKLQVKRAELDAQMDARLSKVFDTNFKRTYNKIMDIYKKRLEALGFVSDEEDFAFNPIDIVGEAVDDIDKILSKNTNSVDEGKEVTKYVTKERTVQNGFFRTIFTFSRTHKEKYTVTEKEWVSKWVEYVDMVQVSNEFFAPMQKDLQELPEKVNAHITSESDRLKTFLQNQMIEVDQILTQKLDELTNMLASANHTEEELNKQRTDLVWMEGIINKVNELIYF